MSKKWQENRWSPSWKNSRKQRKTKNILKNKLKKSTKSLSLSKLMKRKKNRVPNRFKTQKKITSSNNTLKRSKRSTTQSCFTQTLPFHTTKLHWIRNTHASIVATSCSLKSNSHKKFSCSTNPWLCWIGAAFSFTLARRLVRKARIKMWFFSMNLMQFPKMKSQNSEKRKRTERKIKTNPSPKRRKDSMGKTNKKSKKFNQKSSKAPNNKKMIQKENNRKKVIGIDLTVS